MPAAPPLRTDYLPWPGEHYSWGAVEGCGELFG